LLEKIICKLSVTVFCPWWYHIMKNPPKFLQLTLKPINTNKKKIIYNEPTHKGLMSNYVGSLWLKAFTFNSDSHFATRTE
jgi:hypothetical protein